jgi:LysM repeat protein
MAWGKCGRSIYLIAGGTILLVFLVSLLCTTWLFSRRQQPEGSATPAVVFATITPGGPPLNGAQPPSTPAAGSIATPCGPLPAGWMPYIVRPGDTLSQLAEQARVSQAEVLAVNCLASPELLAGSTLYLPPMPSPAPCTVAPPPGWGPYTAQAGDTLSALAAARGIAIDEVQRRNCLASSDLLAGQQLYLPLLPTPTPCVASPLPGWGPYTVQSGDTLFSLAAARGVTAGQVQQVNCLAWETIQVGQQLYLPLLPTPTPTLPQPTPLPPAMLPPIAQADAPLGVLPSLPGAARAPETSQAAAPGIESPGIAGQPPPRDGLLPEPARIIGEPGLPNLVFQPPASNKGAVPCSDDETRLQILGSTLKDKKHEVGLGQRLYFFVYDFPPGEAISATVTWPDSQRQPINPLKTVPDPTLGESENLQAIIDWPVLPFYPLDTYTMTVTTLSSVPAKCIFEVIFPTTRQILVVPPSGSPGSIFQIYHVGYRLNLTTTLAIFGNSDTSILTEGDELPLRGQFSIDINQPFPISGLPSQDIGWGVTSLYLGPTERPGVYLIRSSAQQTQTVRIRSYNNILWLRER